MSVPITKPTVGGDNGAWGTELNTLIDKLNGADYFKFKTAVQNVAASTALVDDTDMAGMVLPVGTFIIEASYLVTGPAAGDIKIAWVFSGTTTTATRGGIGPASTATATAPVTELVRANGAGDTTSAIGTSTPYGLDGTNMSYIQETGVLVVTVAGTLKVQWAQLAASGTTTMNPGSYLQARQVA